MTPPKPSALRGNSAPHADTGDVSAPHPEPGGIAMRAMAGRQAPYLDGLNLEQRQAVETLDGPVLVLAGAGTGKTKALTTRLAHLLNTGRARPGQVLAVTFTNKAAREMKLRIGQLIGSVVEGMQWLGTFHSISAQILRRNAELVDLKSNFSILDTDDQIRLLKQLLEARNIDAKRWPARQLAGFIDSWKNRGLTPDKVPKGEAYAFADGKGAELYGEYQQRLKTLNAADFGDLLLECLGIFQNHPDVLSEYQSRFSYLLVDEYQDTNVAQYLWLRLLAQGHRNICCVGDDDQSIYGWRGAEVDNILRFEKDFPGAKIIRLERNYRSTPHILATASALISHNQDRLGKTLHTDLTDGEKVKVRGLWDGEEEARLIGEDIEQLQRKDHNLDDIAILVRASFQMREFEERFVTLGLPYRVIGGPRFYERMEIRDALAYFKITVQADHDLAFERIINTPKRGLGDVTVKTLYEHARARAIPLMQAAREIIETDELKPRARAALRDLIEHFIRWHAMTEKMPHTELAEIILDEAGYTAMWQNDKTAKAAGRLENLKELIHAMAEFDTMASFLDHISLVMDTSSGESEDKVNLMTLHSAKGLEFNTVFLPGWEEGLFPHKRPLDEYGRTGLEEERRLAYVGITRARCDLRISFVANRRIHNLWQNSLPSRFLDELPQEHVEIENAQSAHSARDVFRDRTPGSRTQPFANTYNSPGWQRAQQRRHNEPTARRGPVTIEGDVVASTEPNASDYVKNERIFHQKYGYGIIAGVDGNKLTIDFDKAGRKRVLANFVERP